MTILSKADQAPLTCRFRNRPLLSDMPHLHLVHQTCRTNTSPDQTCPTQLSQFLPSLTYPTSIDPCRADNPGRADKPSHNNPTRPDKPSRMQVHPIHLRHAEAMPTQVDSPHYVATFPASPLRLPQPLQVRPTHPDKPSRDCSRPAHQTCHTFRIPFRQDNPLPSDMPTHLWLLRQSTSAQCSLALARPLRCRPYPTAPTLTYLTETDPAQIDGPPQTFRRS